MTSISNWEKLKDITPLKHGQEVSLRCRNGYPTGKVAKCDNGEWIIKEMNSDEVKCPGKSLTYIN